MFRFHAKSSLKNTRRARYSEVAGSSRLATLFILLGYKDRQDPGEGGHMQMKGYKGRQGGQRERETRPWRRRTIHPYDEAQGETKGDETLEKATSHPEGAQAQTRPLRRRAHHPYAGVQVQGEIRGDKGRQQGETREDKGRQDPGEGGHTIHVKGYKGRRGETRGDKTLEKVDMPSI